MHLRTAWFAPAALLLACQHAAPVPVSAGAEPTGIAAFTLDPTLLTAKVSPRGTYPATLSEESGRRSLTFVNLATHKVTYVLRPEGELTIGPFYWANDERVVIQMVEHEELPGRAGLAGRDLRRGRDRPQRRIIFGYRAGELQAGSHIRKAAAERAWGLVIDTLRNDPKRAHRGASMDEARGDRIVAISKLDVYRAQDARRGEPHRRGIVLADENGELRIAEGSTRTRSRASSSSRGRRAGASSAPSAASPAAAIRWPSSPGTLSST